jgi:hypothetical protein
VTALHAGPLLARRLGHELYWKVANGLHPLLGEAFFAAMRVPDFPHELFEGTVAGTEELDEAEFRETVAGVASFCGELGRKRPWLGFDVCGFSCTFNQLQASLWAAGLARRDGCRTVFGGFLANGRLGNELAQLREVDVAIGGCGEGTLAAILERDFVQSERLVAAGGMEVRVGGDAGRRARTSVSLFAPSAGPCAPSAGPCAPSAGPCAPSAGQCAPSAGPRMPSFGLSPPSTGPCAPSFGLCPPSPGPGWLMPVVPDYDEYFANATESELARTSLPAEASRGCEHGACTFCSQNSLPSRDCHRPGFLAMCLDTLRSRYPSRDLDFADTSFQAEILDDPAVSAALGHFRAFAEFRALARGEMGNLARSGFTTVQVGVESFNTAVLKRMRKGVTMLDNVLCLREAAENGIDIHYNIILDMPGTMSVELDETEALLPLLHHLPPPTALVPFTLQRDSPAFNKPGKFGIRDVTPHLHHRFLGPGHPPFYFAYEQAGDPPPLAAVHEAFLAWSRAYDHARPLLTVSFQDDTARVRDLRPARFAGSAEYVLDGPCAGALRRCRPVTPEDGLRAALGDAFPSAVRRLSELGLVVRDRGRFLSLPVFESPGSPAGPLPPREPLDSYFS